MSKALLCTVPELARFMRLPIEDIDEDTANDVLVEAGGLVRGEVHQDLDFVVDDIIELRSDGGRALALPQLPVLEVALVRIRRPGHAYVELTADTDYELEGGMVGTLWRLGTTIPGGFPHGTWPHGSQYRGPHGRVEVTVTHGYALSTDDDFASGFPAGVLELPQPAITVVKRVAARGYVNPEGVAQETTGRSTNVQYGDTPGLYLSERDKRDLDCIRPGGAGGTR